MTIDHTDIALERFVASLTVTVDADARTRLLEGLCARGNVWHAAERLKVEADRLRYRDVTASLGWSATIEQLGILAGADTVIALAKMTEALTVFEQDRYAESIALFDQASSLFRASGHDLGWARTQIARTSACLALSRFDEGLQRAEEARAILLDAGDARRVAAIDNNLALLLERMNRPADAISYSERALEFFLGEEHSYHAAHALSNHALLLWRLGRVRKAIEAHAEARDQYIALGASADAAREDVNAGGVFLALGRYAEAVALLSASRRQLIELGSRYQASRAGILLVESLVRLGRYGDATRVAPDLEQELMAYGATPDMLVLSVWHALAHAEDGGVPRAMAILNGAAVLAGDEPDFASYRAILDLARACLLQGSDRGAEAGRLLDPIIPALIGAGLNVEAATANVLRSRVLLDDARSDEALLAAADAVDLAEREGLDWLAAQALHARGCVEETLGHGMAARSSLSLAIRHTARVQRTTAWDDRATVATTTKSLYEDAARLALRHDEPEAALYYVEQAKARALADHLQPGIDVRPRARDAYTAGLLEELASLREQLSWLQARRPGQVSVATSPTRGQAGGADSAATIEVKITAIWRELQAANPLYQSKAAALNIRADDVGDDHAAARRLLASVRDTLAADTRAALLEYSAIGGDLMVFIVCHDKVEVERIAGGVLATQRLVTLLRLNVARSADAIAGNDALPDGLSRNARGILARLYDLLLRPVLRHMGGAMRISVVPHGAAHHVPFHALYDGMRYVVEDYELSYSPCAHLLSHFKARHALLSMMRPENRTSLVMSCSHHGRLPHVDIEGRWVAEALGGTLYSEEEASLGAFSADAAGRRVLHIAAHGSFNPEAPMFSSLQLHDGQLTTLDIFDIELHSSLVTLSACETALGVSRAGDELIGLSRAFLYAGTSSLALSLWMVEDRSTAALMREFYRALRTGFTKAGALRQAQLALLKNEVETRLDVSGPFFWAPFQLIGHAGLL